MRLTVRALQQARDSLSTLDFAFSKQWLWKVLGFSSGAAAAVVVAQQAMDPESAMHDALRHVKERVSSSVSSSIWDSAHQPETTSASAHGRPGSVQGYAARFLADWCAQPERSQLAVALGGGPLLDWLLEAATGPDSTGASNTVDAAEQEQAQRALAYLLQSDATAALVAERPGAIPQLLRSYQSLLATPSPAPHAAPSSPASPAQQLAQALQQRAMTGFTVPQEPDAAGAGVGSGAAEDLSIAGMMRWILGAGDQVAAGVSGQGEAFLADIEEVMAMLLQGARTEEMDSAFSDQVIPSVSGPGAPLPALAGLPQPSTPAPQQQTSSGTPTPAVTLPEREHGSESTLKFQRLCAAWLAAWAEANPGNRDKLTGLNVAAAIAHLAAQVSESAASTEARALQLQLVRLIMALAQSRSPASEYLGHTLSHSVDLPAAPSQPHIADISSPATAQYHLAGCLQPLLYITADAAVERDGVRTMAALGAVRALLRQGGLPVAAAAASEPLQPLLRKIVQSDSVPEVRGAAVRVLAAMAHAPQSLGDTPAAVTEVVSAWRDYLLGVLCQDHRDEALMPLRSACAEALAELATLPGVAGLQVTHYWLASLLASLATRVWPFNAVVYTGPKSQVILPKTFQPAAAATGPESSTAAGGKASGTVTATPSVIDARDFLDAVPVLPSHIASVAAALEEASAAVVEEHEPPPEFDPGSTAPAPLARAFYRQVVRTVDMLVAEERVCQALEVLNALVAADPTKQQWLLSVGVLPLLYRLCHPSDPNAPLWDTTTPGSSTPGGGAAGTDVSPEGGSELRQPPAVVKWIGGAAASVGKSIASTITSMLPPGLKRGAPTEAQEVPQTEVASGTQPGAAQEPSLNSVMDMKDSDVPEPELNDDHGGSSKLCLRRQVARLLALLAIQPEARHLVDSAQWRPWLEEAAQDPDCRLASHATRALLNLAAFRPRTEDWETVLDQALLGPLSPHRASHGTAPVYLDQVHLLNPGAEHLWTLAESGSTPRPQVIMQAENPPLTQPQYMRTPAANLATANLAEPMGSDQLFTSTSCSAGSARGSGNSSRAGLAAGEWLAGVTDQVANVMGSAVHLALSARPSLVYMTPPGWDWHGATALPGSMPSTTSLVPLAPAINSPAPQETGLRASSVLESPALNPQPVQSVSQEAGLDVVDSGGPAARLLPVAHARSLLASEDEEVEQHSGGGQHHQHWGPGQEPLIDVVFVHGIRGGPFITWRKPTTRVKGASATKRSMASLSVTDCWPSDWLPKDAPRARLLTVEYHAPVSGWEGESLPLEATVERVMGQLQAAGVGQRPLVFVAHSMGGLLVKEMLVRSMRAADRVAKASAQEPSDPHKQVVAQQQAGDKAVAERARLVQATRGIVFFATPHFGSGMAAMGWKLRHMPYAAPAPALAQLTPGPHLVELNEALRELVTDRHVRVVSAVEGQATQLSPVIPKLLIVPEASAWPGFGEKLLLPADDHISLCKPANRQAPAYLVVLDVIREALSYATAGLTAP